MNKNWSYVPFSQIFSWCKKSTIGSNDGKPSGKYKLFIASATKIKYFDEYLEEGESLIFGTGGNPCIYYVDEKFAYTNHTETAKKKIDNVNLKFYYYYFQKNRFEQLATTFVGGGIKNSSKKKIGALSVPLPTVEEQNKIVAKIEELFSELDKAVDTLQNIKKQLAVYRQAVLKEAFDVNSYTKIIEISEITDDIRIGPFGTMLHKSDYISNGIPVINPQHIKNNNICESKTITVSKSKAHQLSAYMLKHNDIIMGRRGEMGRTAAVKENHEGWICGTGSIIFRLKRDFDAILYSKILASPSIVHYLEEHAAGTTMKNLNESIVKHIPVPYITIAMQKEIMMNIDKKISTCDNIEKTIDTALMQSEALRQTILKQAFEGELIK